MTSHISIVLIAAHSGLSGEMTEEWGQRFAVIWADTIKEVAPGSR